MVVVGGGGGVWAEVTEGAQQRLDHGLIMASPRHC